MNIHQLYCDTQRRIAKNPEGLVTATPLDNVDNPYSMHSAETRKDKLASMVGYLAESTQPRGLSVMYPKYGRPGDPESISNSKV
jgi:hypothetical protein